MQDSKRITHSNRTRGALLKALSIGLVALFSQACQTPYLTPDQWNARTNAVNAFSNAAANYSQSQRPTYAPTQPQQYRAPTYYQAPYQPATQPEQPLWGEGSLFNQ